MQTKENTLYLTIAQRFFDQIVSGDKTEEWREIKDTTAGRYLKKEGRKFVLNPTCTEEGKTYSIYDYNEGCFPFLPKDVKYLSLAVGYAKERDTALVEVSGIEFAEFGDDDDDDEDDYDEFSNTAYKMYLYNCRKQYQYDNEEDYFIAENSIEDVANSADWAIVFKLGKVLEVHRKQR